ncbi:MAG: hypothetical protein KBT20_10690 [Bacteroidales bacterium]|nr:hypothetical protein [Candidatus Liminaster caballi]
MAAKLAFSAYQSEQRRKKREDTCMAISVVAAIILTSFIAFLLYHYCPFMTENISVVNWGSIILSSLFLLIILLFMTDGSFGASLFISALIIGAIWYFWPTLFENLTYSVWIFGIESIITLFVLLFTILFGITCSIADC